MKSLKLANTSTFKILSILEENPTVGGKLLELHGASKAWTLTGDLRDREKEWSG